MMSTNPTTELPERRPGRPPAHGIDQRERLLDAAIQSFSERGIAATSQRALAREAGVTPAMINYYFGSGEKLIEATVTERLRPVLEELKSRIGEIAGQDCESLISGFVRAMHEIIELHPWLPGLWVREVLSEGGRLRHVFTKRFASELPQPLARRFASAQKNGELNPALEPRLLFVSLIGLTLLPFAARPMWREVFDAKDIDTAQMMSHSLALLTEGIRP